MKPLIFNALIEAVKSAITEGRLDYSVSGRVEVPIKLFGIITLTTATILFEEEGFVEVELPEVPTIPLLTPSLPSPKKTPEEYGVKIAAYWTVANTSVQIIQAKPGSLIEARIEISYYTGYVTVNRIEH